MPGWHANEAREYYARHRDTAPAREMVCFELTWLNAIFSPPVEVAGHLEKSGELPGRTEDTWSLLMRLRNGGAGHMTSTMACPKDYLRGCCFGSEGVATWDIQSGEVTLRTRGDEASRRYQFGATGTVLEASYAEEITTFVDAVLGRKAWPQSYALSQQSAAALAAAEKSSATGRWVKVDPDAEPERSPPPPRTTAATG
jgi:predicted dehydrogenase